MSIKFIPTINVKFFCRGDNNHSLGHPAASLIINYINKQAICPYCSAVYFYNESNNNPI